MKKLVSGLVLTLLLINISALTFNVQQARSEPATWIVDDDGQADFHTIQEAINASKNGDTILVMPGAYCENLYVDKSVRLLAKNQSATIISKTKDVGSTVRIIARNASIIGFTIKGGAAGIFLHGKKDQPVKTIVKHNRVVDCTYGIYVYWSNGSIIADNIVENNTKGIFVYWSSARILKNTVKNNKYGIYLDGSRISTVENNLIEDNKYGVFIDYLSCNRIYRNNFIDNDCNAYVNEETESIWNSSFPFIGNYWSNYNGTDADQDGIGDEPYIINKNNVDNYPLMGMFSRFNASFGYFIDVISNSTINDFRYYEHNSTIVIHASSITADQAYGFCRLTIPHGLMPPPYNITVNGNLVKYKTVFENETLSVVYFSYKCPRLKMGIPPEFLLAFLSLILISIVLVILVVKKKLPKRPRESE